MACLMSGNGHCASHVAVFPPPHRHLVAPHLFCPLRPFSPLYAGKHRKAMAVVVSQVVGQIRPLGQGLVAQVKRAIVAARVTDAVENMVLFNIGQLV